MDKEQFNKLFNAKPNEEIKKLLEHEIVINHNIPLPNFKKNIKKMIDDLKPSIQLENLKGFKLNNNKGEDE